MQNINFSDLADLMTNAFYDIWDLAGDYGRDPKIYMHWSAGLYDTCFEFSQSKSSYVPSEQRGYRYIHVLLLWRHI